MRTAVIKLSILLGTGLVLSLGTSSARPQLALAQTGDVLEQLRDQARRWQAKGRLDKAAEAYEKVLRSLPDDVEAIEALGLWHAQAGHTDKARALLAQLTKLAPKSQGTERLRAALSVGKGQDGLITQARAQVRAGDTAAAVASYEQAFGGAKPPQHLALEYYQTMGGTDAGWERARSGLEELLREKPTWKEARLALARHLTYRERTRREGIDKLRELSADSAVRADATASWRQALLWLQITVADQARLSAYLEQVGEDPAVRAKLGELFRGGAVAQRGSSAQAGYQALEREDVDEASRQFAKAGDVPEAVVGLAVVAMRKDDFELAVKLLEGASVRFPTKQDQWGQPLRSARFWLNMRRADQQLSKNPAEAERLLREAITISPEESHHARAALASLLQSTGRIDAAEGELRQALVAQPEQPFVLRALINLLVEKHDYQSAIEANMKLTALDARLAWAPGLLEAEVLRRRALEQRATGDLEHAHAMLLEAEKLAPENFWVLHDLAGLELELGESTRAQERVQRLMDLKPNDPAARVLRARIETELGRPEAGLELLAGLPASAAGGQVGKLREELALKKELDLAVRASARTGSYASRRELLRLQKQAEARPELTGQVALAWAEIGEPERGIDLLQQQVATQKPVSRGALLQLAAVYLRAERDEELRQLLEELASDPTMPPRARRDLAKLHVAFAVGQADRLAQAGEYSRALLQLEPLLAEYPDNAALLAGLGRLFIAAGDYGQASSTFTQVLRREPANIEARDGAVSAALASGDVVRARELVEEGLRAQPRSARMHMVAAHYALARGDDAGGMRALKKARELADRGAAGSASGAGASKLVASDSRGLVSAARAELSSKPLSASEGKTMVADIDRQIDQVRGRHAVQIQLEPGFRHREGERGLGRLTELRLPVAVSVPLGYFGRLDVGADVVSLNAGAANLDQVDLAARFGSLGRVPATAPQRAQDDVGIAPHLALSFRDKLKLELGATPLGFLHSNIVGALSYRFQWGNYALTLRGERAAITDSLLSYAGTTDPATGQKWGAVVAQGGSLDFAVQTPAYLFYALGMVRYLTGERVPDNLSGRIATGLRWTLYDWEGHSLRFGGTALGMAFAKNQSGFTLGQGGYFSPEWFVRAGAPLSYRYAGPKLATKLEFDPGLNWFQREKADYYPLARDFQQQLAAIRPVSTYGGDDNLGFSLNLIGEARYDVTQQLALGAAGSMHFANDYREYRASLFARLSFNRRVNTARTKP